MEFIHQVYFGNTILQYLLFFLSIVIGIVLGKICYYLFQIKLKKYAEKSKTKLDDYLLDVLEEPLVLLVVTAGFSFGKYFLALSPGTEKFFANIVFILIAMAITWFLLRLIDMLISHYVEPLVAKTESKLDDQILPILKSSLKTILFLMSLIIVFSNLGYDILSLLTGLGIGGLAIALAAQDIMKNIVGGISIFWDKPFQVDDWIEIEGKYGTVQEVGLRTTRIRTIDKTTVVIPNCSVVDSVIENFSLRNRRRAVVNIGLVYGTSADKMEQAIEIIRQTIQSIDGTDHDEIMIRFVNFGAYSLDLEIAYWITRLDEWKMVIHRVNMGIKRNLDDAKIEMAFPTETHYVIHQK